MRWKALLLACALIVGSQPAAPSSAAAPANRNRVDQNLRELAAHRPDDHLPVLIQRRSGKSALQAVQTHNGTVKRSLKLANTVVAEVPARKLDEMASDPDVVRISYDAPMQSQANLSTSSGSKLDPNALLAAYPFALGSTQAWTNGFRGTGVTVAVLDSGIDDGPDFQGTRTDDGAEYPSGTSRVIKKAAIATSAQGSPLDDNGHGTFVSGIIGGRGWANPTTSADDSRYVGVAPDVNLISLKVSDHTGAARTSDVLAGLEWVMQNQATYNIRVVNLSLVSSVAESYKTSVLDAAVELAWLKGIVVVVSAGNAGPDTMKYAPANDPFVIVVGATDDMGTRDTGDDLLASFSSYGATLDGFSKPDLVAPGRHIVSIMSSPNDPLPAQFPANVVNPYYIRLSGTSAAAPVVTGNVALLFQIADSLNVKLTPDQAKWVLAKTAKRVPGTGTGAGYPSVVDAAAYIYKNPTSIGSANQHLLPNNYLVLASNSTTGSTSASWETVAWETVAWETVAWETVAWETVAWETVAGN